MLFANPVPGPRIVPYGEARLPTDRLPDGQVAFRITQRFSDPDYYWTQHGKPNAIHGALDMGDSRCGDKVLAAGDGKAKTGVDSAGGRYVLVDHGNGWVTAYWHLSKWTIPQGVWVNVHAGDQIGWVGTTGLSAACHLHFETRYSGVKRDPWPLLRQNAPEVVMQFGGADFQHCAKDGKTLKGARFRSAATTKEGDIYATFEEDTPLFLHAQVKGESVNGDDTWYLAWAYAKGAYRLGALHASVFKSITERAPERDPRLDRVATALAGVANALDAALQAIRAAISTLKEK